MRHHLAPHPAPLRSTPPWQAPSADPCSASRNPPPVGRPGNVQSIAQMSIASAPRWLCGDGYSPENGCHGLSSACRANSKASRAPPTSNQVHRQPQTNPRPHKAPPRTIDVHSRRAQAHSARKRHPRDCLSRLELLLLDRRIAERKALHATFVAVSWRPL